MEQLVASVGATVATLGAIWALVGGYRRWRRFQKQGGPEASMELTATLRETLDAQKEQITAFDGLLTQEREERERDKVRFGKQLDDAQATILELSNQFKGCKDRLIKLERLVSDRAIAEASHDPR